LFAAKGNGKQKSFSLVGKDNWSSTIALSANVPIYNFQNLNQQVLPITWAFFLAYWLFVRKLNGPSERGKLYFLGIGYNGYQKIEIYANFKWKHVLVTKCSQSTKNCTVFKAKNLAWLSPKTYLFSFQFF
jgi:hypothetical protein